MIEIELYQELVDRCARERLDQVIPNGSPVHARVLISKLFETARQEVFLFSGRLKDTTIEGEEIYGEASIIEHATNFLRRPGSKLRIILQHDMDRGDNNRLLKALIEDQARKGEVYLYRCDGATNATKPPHFMVTDALAFRYETDDYEARAIANFGDRKSAKTLTEFFLQLVDRFMNTEKTLPVYA